jgi:GntR family transcriptional repressor for pyruvate dehydrogenase complex
MLRAIKKTRIYEAVVEQIHDLIRQGKLRAGDQLPSERELAETFQVSRASVREAIRALETEGLVVTRTGMGTFVADLPVESLVAPFARFLAGAKDALADVFEMRRLVEPQIAALAAERVAEPQVEEMRRILEDQRRDIQQGRTGVEADAAFHFAIGRATQNQALEKLVSFLMDALAHSREESLQNLDRRRASLASHREILAAIEARSPARAREAMLKHIEAVERSVLSARGRKSPAFYLDEPVGGPTEQNRREHDQTRGD